MTCQLPSVILAAEGWLTKELLQSLRDSWVKLSLDGTSQACPWGSTLSRNGKGKGAQGLDRAHRKRGRGCGCLTRSRSFGVSTLSEAFLLLNGERPFDSTVVDVNTLFTPSLRI